MSSQDQGINASTQHELLEAFALYDKDGDGLITAPDALQMFNALGLGFTKEDIEVSLCYLAKYIAFSKLGITRLARDGKNFITPAEFVSMIGQTISSSEISQVVNSVFDTMDRTGDGFVDAEELANRLSVTIEPTTPRAAEQLLALLDADGDGRVNKQEFAAIIRGGFQGTEIRS